MSKIREVNISHENLLLAGTYYRLWKSIANKAAIEICNLLDLKVENQSKLLKLSEKTYKLEVEAGFERILQNNWPELHTSDFTRVFYGDFHTEPFGEVEEVIYRNAIKILDEIIRSCV